MTNKGFANIQNNIDTPDHSFEDGKPSNTKKKVDINILKSKLKEVENKEFKKNLIIFSFLILALGALGIYFSF